MIFISKPIYDPTQTPGWLRQRNKLGRTIGLVFYLPKYWSCRERKYVTEEHPSLPKWYTELQREYEASHANCRWPYKHRSHIGYLYWIGPKRRYQLHYMGDINPANDMPKWGWIRKHGLYTRWLDNGPQSTPVLQEERDEMLALHTALVKKHKDNDCLFMTHKFAECICPDRARMPQL